MAYVRFYGGPLDGLLVDTDEMPLRTDEHGRKLDIAQDDCYRLVADDPQMIPTYVWSALYGHIRNLEDTGGEQAA